MHNVYWTLPTEMTCCEGINKRRLILLSSEEFIIPLCSLFHIFDWELPRISPSWLSEKKILRDRIYLLCGINFPSHSVAIQCERTSANDDDESTKPHTDLSHKTRNCFRDSRVEFSCREIKVTCSPQTNIFISSQTPLESLTSSINFAEPQQ